MGGMKRKGLRGEGRGVDISSSIKGDEVEGEKESVLVVGLRGKGVRKEERGLEGKGERNRTEGERTLT